MPLIDPVLAAQLRRHWQVVAAVLVFLAFTVVHLLVFQPSARRYQAAIKRAAGLGLALEAENPPPMMPPRVVALLTDNSLPTTAAGMERESGALTAALLEDVSQLTARHGMRVMSTEPGTTAQEPRAVQVRAHLTIQCTFQQFVAFLDDLSESNQLIAVDRFELAPGGSGRNVLELWVTRYILKQTERRVRS
jgi:hypothetical protein